MFIISTYYARQEQIAEITEHIPDTAWLDNKYFFEEDFSPEATIEGFARTIWTPEYIELMKEELNKQKEREK